MTSVPSPQVRQSLFLQPGCERSLEDVDGLGQLAELLKFEMVEVGGEVC